MATSLSETMIPHDDSLWDKKFREMIAYTEKNGHEWKSIIESDPNASHIVTWMRRQRRCRSNSTMTVDRINKLDSVGFVWTPPDAKTGEWNRKFAMYCDFVENNGVHCIPPTTSVLGKWIRYQRSMNRFGGLKEDRIEKLNKIGFLWNGPSTSERTDAFTVAWDQNFALYRDFVEENGMCCPPKKKSKMSIWVYSQRKMKRLGTLKKDRLDKLNKMGFLWSAPIPSERSDSSTAQWDENFAMYRDFVEKNGICCPPKKKSKMSNWIHMQRTMERLGKLKKDRMEKLNKVGFLWSAPVTSEGSDALTVEWDQNFAMYRDFVDKNGIRCAAKTNSNMNKWIRQQRKRNRLGSMKKDQMDKLNKIGFLWIAPNNLGQNDALTVAWDQHFALYREFIVKNGICCPPRMNSKMSNWIHTQRQRKRLGTLKEDRMEKLNEIGFLWTAASFSERTSALTIAWDRNFAMYRDFVEKNGPCYDPKTNSELSTWIHRQREIYSFGNLTTDRMDKLNKVGFLWSAPSALEQSNHTDLPTLGRSQATAPGISCEDSLDCATNVNHKDLPAHNNRFGHCSAVASPQERVLTLDTQSVSASVSNKGCDGQNEPPPGHKSNTVDEQSARLDDTVLFVSECDERIVGRLPLKTNTQTNNPRRMRPREGGCRAREIVIHQMQCNTFTPDSVGYKVMSRLLSKLTTKGDVKI